MGFFNCYILSLFPMLQLMSVGSHPVITNVPEEPECSCSTPSRQAAEDSNKMRFQPSHPKAEQNQLPQPLLEHLVLQSPLISSVPMYCTPIHQPTMPQIHSSSPHQKMVFFATCLKQEGLHLGVSLLLLSFSLWLCVHKHLQAICCKYKVRPSLMKDDFLQYLQDYMNCAGDINLQIYLPYTEISLD